MKEITEFRDETNPRFRMFRLCFGQLLLWLRRQWQRPEEEGKGDRPESGMFANFEAPPCGVEEMQPLPYEFLWALLARYASFVNARLVTENCA